MTIQQAKQKLISWALAEVGTSEGANNWNKYAQDTHLQQLYGWNAQNQPWCDLFTDEAFVNCFGLENGAAMTYQRIGSGSAACRYSAQFFKDNGAWSSTPQPGAVIFFFYDGAINHQGIVVSVQGSVVFTVEGNSGDKVSRNKYNIGDARIAGYGIPKWELVADEDDQKPTPSEIKGIDISNWQRGIDLTALQTDFIICKISEGDDWTDPWFDEFYNAAKVPVGAYVYSHATTEAAAVAEAKKALYLLNGRKLPLGVFLDVEESAQLALSDAALTAVVKAFCDAIKAGGYRAGAYGSAGNLWRKVGPANLGDDVLAWVASWGVEPRLGCDIWQYSDSERLPGFTGNLDGNKAMSERFAAIINGSEPAPEPPGREYRIPEAKYHAYVYQVDLNLLKIGDEGPLVQSLQLLLNGKGFPCGKDDGEFGTDTRDALLAFQSAAGILADGECGGQSWAALHNYRV